MFLSKRGRLYFFELAQQPVHDFRNRAPFYSYSLNSVDQFSFLGNRARYRAGVANFGKAVYPSLERSTQDTRDGFFFVQCAGLIFLAARWFRRAYSRPFWITSFEFVKDCGIRFSIWESFIGFYICCYPITTIFECFFSVGVRISWKKLCWMRAWRRRWHLVSPTLYIIIVYTVNLNKLSRNFVGALRTTTTNCRVSFIDLYLVFPINFRIVFLPHTNTVILLEPHCGTITDTGWPVGWYGRWTTAGRFETWAIWMLAPLNRAWQTVGTRTHLRWPISLIGSVDKTKFYERILARTSFKADYVFRVVHRNIQVNHTYTVTSKD